MKSTCFSYFDISQYKTKLSIYFLTMSIIALFNRSQTSPVHIFDDLKLTSEGMI